MNKLTCCFTGHRYLPADQLPKICKELELEIDRMISRGIFHFAAGGAVGFDSMAERIILEKKNNNKNLSLSLILPCKNQAKYWTPQDCKNYYQILSQADHVVYTSERYYQGCMQKRNRYLVSISDWCIGYLRKTYGGTKYTIDCCSSNGTRVILL